MADLATRLRDRHAVATARLRDVGAENDDTLLTEAANIVELAKAVAVYFDAPKDYEMDNGEAGILVEWEPVWLLNEALNGTSDSERSEEVPET